jgi:hypothetical protein
MISEGKEGGRAISVSWLSVHERLSFIHMLRPVILNLGCANTAVLLAMHVK